MIERSELDEFTRETGNYRQCVSTMAHRLIGAGASGAAGRLLVLDHLLMNHANEIWLAVNPLLPAEAAPKPVGRAKAKGERQRAAVGQGAHRHKFGADGRCTCGAERQRAPRGQGERSRPDAAARTVPLPLAPLRSARPTLGEHAPDPFEGGTMGSSSAGDRSRP